MAQENWWDNDPVANPTAQPAPRPGPVMGAPVDPAKRAADARAQSAEQRAQEDQAFQRQKFATEQERAARLEKKDSAGTVDEKKVATLTTRLVGAFGDISSITAKDPSAQEPGLIETWRGGLQPGGLLGVPVRKLAGANRRTVYDAQRDALDALLTLGTGAAYNSEQLDAQTVAYFPQYDDTDEERDVKNRRFQRLMEAAKANAGPAWAQVEPAIAPFMSSLTATLPHEPANPDGYYDEETNTVVGTLGSPENPVDGNDPAYQQFAAGVGDIVEGGINNTVGLVANPINTTLFRALGYDNYTSDIGQTARDALGLPEGNQTIGAINQAVTGGLVTGGLASIGGKSAALPGMAQNALAQYGATPVRDAVTAGTAAAAGEGARASGAGPAGQFAATLAGGFTPAAGAGLVQRAASRGAKPNALAAEVMGPFERSNVPMRQADFDPAARPQRAALEKSDKGRPIIQAADEADQAAMEARLSEIGGAGRVADSPYDTGAMVQGALTRQGDKTKTAARARYERAEKLSGDPAIEPTQAISAAARHVADLQAGGANTNAAEIKFLTGLGEDLSAPGGKTISQLRDLRTNLRGRLKEQGLDHGQAEARALSIMDAASADIENGLKTNPRALEQYKAGDRIWRERADFRKNVTAQLIGKNGEKSAIDTASQVNILAKKDPVKMKRLMDEFEPDERADFVATIAANLGRNNKSEFTPNLFLNNLDPRNGKISPQALRLVFGDDGVKAIKDLQAVAKSKIAARSDTAPSGASIQNMKRGLRQAIFAGMGFSTGGVGGAVAAPVVEGFFANLSDARKARLLTNPVFTKQLRNAPETTNPKAINTYFDRMTQSAAKSPVFAMDVEAFKQALAGAANKSTTAAAAGEQEQN